MASFHDEIHPFRARRGQTRDAFAGINDDQITAPVAGGGDVRYSLWQIAIAMGRRRVELARTFAALSWQQTEAQRTLALTMESRGELRSILLGVPDEYIDMEPAPGEWSVRQALEHAHTVDQRYMQATEYAVERIHSDQDLPIQRPTDGRPRAEDERLPGRLAEVLTRLHLRRDEVVSHLAGLTDGDLAAPVIYRGENVDVRYRLHLFSAHEREHTGQVARTLRAVGFAQSEAQMILGQTELARGVVEGMLIGIPDELLTRTPPGGLPSVHDILARGVVEEDSIADSIKGAMAVA
jgi:uncharacterized damage-inducible protein DinB